MLNKIVIDSTEQNSIFQLRDILSNEIISVLKSNRFIILLCIGTDRSTGDCLGPLVGEKLHFLIRNHFVLYGTLETPIHAKNLDQTLKEINSTYKNPYIIAIDACLGSIQNVGNIIIENKPLKPGSAVNKDLPYVGDLSITGIVNVSGALEFMVLQNTRLYTVMHLADIISKGIYHSIIKSLGNGKNLPHANTMEQNLI